MLRKRTHERVERLRRVELQNRAGHRAMGLAVHRDNRFLRRTFGDAEDGSVLGIEPVRVVPHAVLFLDRNIGFVSFGHHLRREIWIIVTIDEQRHAQNCTPHLTHRL